MPSTHRNRLVTAISNTPGTSGALTIAAAASGYRTFEAGDNGLSFDVSIIDGTSWEIRTGCVYTHSGTSLARGTLEDSSTGADIALTSAAIVTVTLSAALGNRIESATLTQVTGTDANTTMAVGNVYVVDMSAWATADRTYTLPAVAAVGDRVSVMVSAGDDSHELIITAASGDTLNGIAGGTEWSRVFITGEVVTMRCVSANAAWIVEVDGRIPQAAKMYLSSYADGETANTYTLPTAAATPGAWTDEFDNANLTSPSNSRIYTRRAAALNCIVSYVPKDVGTASSTVNLEIRKNGTTVIGGPSTIISGNNINRITAGMFTILPEGEYLDYYYRTQHGSIGAIGIVTTNWACTFAIFEVLP